MINPSNFIIFTFILTSISPSITASSTKSPWVAKFMDLAGSRPGDANSAVYTLKKYLRRFGYLDSNLTDIYDDALESALRTYQQNFNLDATGLPDLPTINHLVSPRCGVADIISGASSMSSGKISGRNLFEFFPGNPTWPQYKKLLTYSIDSTSSVPMDPSVIRAVFARAFARWSAVTTLSFAEVSSGFDADIKIGFYSGDHGDGEAFDGSLRTLAHAFSPTDGRMHFDAAEEWAAEGEVTGDEVDLESVAVHEIGHLLGLGHSSKEEAVMYPGLGHSSKEEAVMYPMITTGTRKVELAEDDVEGVRRLYGRKVGYEEENIAPAWEGMGRSDGGKVEARGFVFVMAGIMLML